VLGPVFYLGSIRPVNYQPMRKPNSVLRGA
jgi:hypothetical protein